ncbi:hypothetical protein [Erythrobacter westpacificensis]|jgi:hypothetical protein
MKPIHLAFAGALAGASVLSAPPAFADDNTWACEVVLCLSNPGGPTQYSACVPPITKLWRTLAFGGGFPTCTGSGIRDTDYDKADDGRPARLTVEWTDGRRQTFYQGRTSSRPTPTIPGRPPEWKVPRNVDLQ